MIQEYEPNPAPNWKAKDCVLYLVTAFTSRQPSVGTIWHWPSENLNNFLKLSDSARTLVTFIIQMQLEGWCSEILLNLLESDLLAINTGVDATLDRISCCRVKWGTLVCSTLHWEAYGAEGRETTWLHSSWWNLISCKSSHKSLQCPQALRISWKSQNIRRSIMRLYPLRMSGLVHHNVWLS
jgi:hypothetical protein